MKNKIFLYSLTSLAVAASSLAFADETVYVPTLEGGLTASVGTFYVTPTSDFQDYSFLFEGDNSYETVENVNPGYQLGIDASLGYIFEETANSVELFFRNISTSDSGSAQGSTARDGTVHSAYGDIGYELESFDLMFSQFVNLGEVMQLRLSGGLAYLELETNETAQVFGPTGEIDFSYENHGSFRGWGPRVAIDTRYDFGGEIEGLGIVGGGSMAYFQGDMDSNGANEKEYYENNPGNHAVLNFRANLGVDYVYFFDNGEGSTLGLELGYLIDYYDDGATATSLTSAENIGDYGTAVQTSSVSFAGPYVNLKGVF